MRSFLLMAMFVASLAASDPLGRTGPDVAAGAATGDEPEYLERWRGDARRVDDEAVLVISWRDTGAVTAGDARVTVAADD